MADLTTGTRIGSYSIVRQIGEGGMGVVFEAIHAPLGRRVAIKVLHEEYARSPQIVGRFFNEARAVNLIEHPGLVQIYDLGQLPDGTGYIVMEYLRGESLGARRFRLGGTLPVAEAIRLLHLVADALATAHERGIIHRDLKPENVIVVPDPNVAGGERTKLLDFGIAKLGEHSTIDKTRTAAIMGTPHFMSPEQCRGAGHVDERTDVYSLGVMLYLLLAGRPPFDGEGAGEIMGKHMYEPPPSLRDLAPGLPPAVVDLVDSLLHKDRQRRPVMRQVAAELLAFESQEPMRVAARIEAEVRAVPGLPAASTMLASPPSTLGASQGEVSLSLPRRYRAWFVLAAVTVLVGGMLTAVRFGRQPKADHTVRQGSVLRPELSPVQKVYKEEEARQAAPDPKPKMALKFSRRFKEGKDWAHYFSLSALPLDVEKLTCATTISDGRTISKNATCSMEKRDFYYEEGGCPQKVVVMATTPGGDQRYTCMIRDCAEGQTIQDEEIACTADKAALPSPPQP